MNTTRATPTLHSIDEQSNGLRAEDLQIVDSETWTRMAAARLTDTDLWVCLSEAEARKSDSGLPIDVRVRSFETYALCLREAHNRGYDYATLRAAATR